MISSVKNNEKKSKALPVSGKFIVGPGVNVNGCMSTSKRWFSHFMFSGKSKLKPAKSSSSSSLSNSSSRTSSSWKEYSLEDDKSDPELSLSSPEDI